MSQGFLIERSAVVSAFVPIDTNAAAQTGDWVHMREYRRCQIILSTGAWAGGTAAVTLNQAKTNAGGSSKALAFTRYWLSTALTTDIPTLTTVVANTFNLSAANKIAVIEVHVNDLDVANGFYYVNVATASPGANADLVCGIYVLYDPAYGEKADARPTVISG